MRVSHASPSLNLAFLLPSFHASRSFTSVINKPSSPNHTIIEPPVYSSTPIFTLPSPWSSPFTSIISSIPQRRSSPHPPSYTFTHPTHANIAFSASLGFTFRSAENVLKAASWTSPAHSITSIRRNTISPSLWFVTGAPRALESPTVWTIFPGGAPSALIYRLHMAFMLEHGTSLGWIINWQNFQGHPVPSTSISALGKRFSSSGQRFFSLMLKSTNSTPTRSIATYSLCRGPEMIAAGRPHHLPCLCLGPASGMRTRAVYSNVERCLKLHARSLEYKGALGWSRYVALRADTKLGLRFWIADIARISGQPFHRCAQVRVIDADSLLDAGAREYRLTRSSRKLELRVAPPE